MIRTVTIQIAPVALRVKADALSRSLRVRAMYVPQRMSVLLHIIVAMSARRGLEERPDAEAEKYDLHGEDWDRRVEGEALHGNVSTQVWQRD